MKPIIYEPYDPLRRVHLAESVAQALLNREAVPLPPPDRFLGAGLYAIYYSGDFPPYRRLAEVNSEKARLPIYVGKAQSEGARKGIVGVGAPTRAELYGRLGQHAKSVSAASNLSLHDFTCRFLVVEDIWVALGEWLLIERFKPLWNIVVDGFGNHDPGKGRYKGQLPLWDALHPGRAWAAKLEQPALLSQTEIVKKVETHLSKGTPSEIDLAVVGTNPDIVPGQGVSILLDEPE